MKSICHCNMQDQWDFLLNPPTSSNWILATGFWEDGGVWVDTDVWND